MRVTETRPTARQFTLTVSEDELRVLTEAVNVTPNLTSGEATDYSVWDELNDFLDENNIKKLSD